MTNCCELCRPNNLEIENGLNTCRNIVCGCHFKPMEKETWEEELELQFGDMLNMVEVQAGVSERQPIKDFISFLLASQKEKMLGVLEGMEKDDDNGGDFRYNTSWEKGFNKCLSDIKKKIEEL